MFFILDYIIGDCRKVLKEIPDSSVNLVVTSPPYNISKNYNKYEDNLSYTEWYLMIDEAVKEIKRVLKPNGSFFLNLSNVAIDNGKGKEILPLPYIGYQILQDNGLFLKNNIIWTFNSTTNCTKRLSGRYENVLWAVKDINNYVFNLDDVRLPYINPDEPRVKNGKGRNPTDVWYFNQVNNKKKKYLGITHPTVFPLPMIVRILKMSSNEGDMILDPFVGSGTTLVASKILNRNCIGIDIDSKYKEECMHRLDNEGNMSAELFNENPK